MREKERDQDKFSVEILLIKMVAWHSCLTARYHPERWHNPSHYAFPCSFLYSCAVHAYLFLICYSCPCLLSLSGFYNNNVCLLQPIFYFSCQIWKQPRKVFDNERVITLPTMMYSFDLNYILGGVCSWHLPVVINKHHRNCSFFDNPKSPRRRSLDGPCISRGLEISRAHLSNHVTGCG